MAKNKFTPNVKVVLMLKSRIPSNKDISKAKIKLKIDEEEVVIDIAIHEDENGELLLKTTRGFQRMVKKYGLFN